MATITTTWSFTLTLSGVEASEEIEISDNVVVQLELTSSWCVDYNARNMPYIGTHPEAVFSRGAPWVSIRY